MVISWGNFRKMIHNTNQVYAKCFIADSVSLRYTDYSFCCLSSCAFLVTQWFVLCILNIIHVLRINLIPHIYIILHNVLLLIWSLSYLLLLLWIYGTLNYYYYV